METNNKLSTGFEQVMEKVTTDGHVVYWSPERPQIEKELEIKFFPSYLEMNSLEAVLDQDKVAQVFETLPEDQSANALECVRILHSYLHGHLYVDRCTTDLERDDLLKEWDNKYIPASEELPHTGIPFFEVLKGKNRIRRNKTAEVIPALKMLSEMADSSGNLVLTGDIQETIRKIIQIAGTLGSALHAGTNNLPRIKKINRIERIVYRLLKKYFLED